MKHGLCLLHRPPWSTWVTHLFTASAQNTYFKVKNRWLNVFRAQGKKIQKQKTPILTSTHHHNCRTATFCFYVWLICTQNIYLFWGTEPLAKVHSVLIQTGKTVYSVLFKQYTCDGVYNGGGAVLGGQGRLRKVKSQVVLGAPAYNRRDSDQTLLSQKSRTFFCK